MGSGVGKRLGVEVQGLIRHLVIPLPARRIRFQDRNAVLLGSDIFV